MYFDINDCFLLYDLGSVECLKGQGGKGKPATAKTGPNDARCVVRALGEFFFFSLYFLILTYRIFRFYWLNTQRRKAVTTKKGPNDARHVVWALGKFFFVFFSS